MVNQCDIWVDAGHGGSNGSSLELAEIKRDDLNLEIALLFGEACTRSGVMVGYTRTSNTPATPEDRVELANDSLARLFISFHFYEYRISAPRGLTVYGEYPESVSDTFAKKLYAALTPLTSWSDQGIYYNDTWLIMSQTTMPSAIVQYSFLRGTEEEELINSEYFKKIFAEEAARVAIECLGYGFNYVPPNGDPGITSSMETIVGEDFIAVPEKEQATVLLIEPEPDSVSDQPIIYDSEQLELNFSEEAVPESMTETDYEPKLEDLIITLDKVKDIAVKLNLSDSQWQNLFEQEKEIRIGLETEIEDLKTRNTELEAVVGSMKILLT